MILHIAYLDKFIPEYLELLANEFDGSEHGLFYSGDDEKFSLPCNNVERFCKKNYRPRVFRIALLWKMYRAEKIILHGLFDKNIVRILFRHPWLLRKCYWVIWGGDLYGCFDGSYEQYRQRVIREMGHLVTYIDGDVELAREKYDAKGIAHQCLMYKSNTFHKLAVAKSDSKELVIQVGNSADPSNNHFEIFSKLLEYRDLDVKVFVPLSYGDPVYAETVVQRGRELFGDNFIPLLNFIPFNEYLEYLSRIDVAIFNHERQQAMGNIITLLGLGKKVYLRSDITPWETLTKKGLVLFDTLELDLHSNSQAVKSNINIVNREFSYTKLVAQWRELFEKE